MYNNATRIKSGREIADTPRAISEGDKKNATFVQRDGDSAIKVETERENNNKSRTTEISPFDNFTPGLNFTPR